MAEDVTRAVGGKGPEPIKINGKDCFPKPLTLKELGELERDCISRYRKDYVKGFSDVVSELPEAMRVPLIMEKVNEAGHFELKTLPAKFVYEPKKIELTNQLKIWLEENMDGYLDDTAPGKSDYDQSLRIAAAQALDQGVLTEEKYQELCKKPARKTKVAYVNWWTTGTFDGMLSMIHLSFRDYGVSREDVAEAIGNKKGILAQVAREIEKLSAPEPGNG